MRVLLLSNGPSLERYHGGREGCDFVVGVNRAAGLWPVDLWVFCDAATFGDPTKLTRPLGTPTLCIHSRVYRGLTALFPQARRRLDTHTVMRPFVDEMTLPKPVPGWRSYSGLAGLGAAWYLGATTVATYGVDMAGESDCTGREDGTRKADRWAREQTIWRQILDSTGLRWLNADERTHRLSV